ncbi:MAG: acyltransferase [Sedimenticola sp.]|nr:MAG: acyltransferase [Sedimenticola sp.]
MRFRQDINGLRAYAVIAVMLYHFSIDGFSGGFIGVDVFFVISGFLMTGIIMRGIEQGRFSVTDFYLSRARRIIPALAVLCLVLLALGWAWLTPSDYRKLGEHAASAMGFFSNFTFMDEEGYFDAPSQTKWLLHTWSLSVEWQFYLLYPLLLAAVAKTLSPSPRTMMIVLIILALLSLGACIDISREDGSFAFYMLPTRAWEMLAGGLVFLLNPRVRSSATAAKTIELAGLGCIILAAGLFQPEMNWPGAYALLPVAGAVLIMVAARQDSALTASPAISALGRWSYSIYLWHWPIVVTLGYFSLRTLPYVVGGFLLAILLGAISYALVENPARHIFASRRRATIASLAAILVIAAGGTLIVLKQGFESRVSDQLLLIDREADNRLQGFNTPCGFARETQTLVPCTLGDENNIRWVVWGDSHAGSIVSAVQAATQAGVRFYTHQCATLFNTELKAKAQNNHCVEFNRKVLEQIEQLPGDVGVIIINRYSVHIKGPNEGLHKRWGIIYTDRAPDAPIEDAATLYSQRLVGSLCRIGQSHKVYTVAPIPEIGTEVPQTMARRAMASGQVVDITLPLADYYSRNDVALAALNRASDECGIRVLDPTPHLCDETVCYGSLNGRPLYFDDDHLSEFGNRLLLPLFSGLRTQD